MSTVVSLRDELVHWLRTHALPLWDLQGVDRRGGGYYESLAFEPGTGSFIRTGELRRGRVVARQLYVFDAGRRLGWASPQADPVRHGCRFLFAHLHVEDGIFHSAIDATTREVQGFSLYETAFYLFALARVEKAVAGEFPVRAAAMQCLRELQRRFGRDNGGFNESEPASLPLKSNPHMHLLEAALAWLDGTAGEEQQPWIELARALCRLCLEHFIDRDTGAIREYFDACWQPMPGASGRIVEPGHQFEWAWLLLQWAATPHSTAEERLRCSNAARRLVELAERHGVDPARGVAFNELWDDLTPKDTHAKLWPQTERVKAWCALLGIARTREETDLALRKLTDAIRGLTQYFDTAVPGLWREVLRPDGTFVAEPSKASSLYHVVCAIDTVATAAAAATVAASATAATATAAAKPGPAATR